MTALARNWRPKVFQDYVGQSHVTKSIENALINKRLHHAYLFSGTRGVGKTTIARIFAKALSCKNGITANPCDQCSNCNEINQGTFIDLIEVDAASKTKVEDTRELLDHTQFIPHSGKFKIFIIDEVHMLSNHSFNALLKTLEEPPEHVKFLLATTDPEKLPVTVLSRCLHYKLLPLTQTEIEHQIIKILKAERINFEPNALKLIAKSANGSLRDALSSTDQIIALADSNITIDSVTKLLGLVDEQLIKQLFYNILEANKSETLELVANMYQNGTDLKKVLFKIMEFLHEMLLDLTLSQKTNWISECNNWLAKSITQQKELLQYWYQIASFAVRDFDYAPTDLVAMNICIIRMLEFTNSNEQPKQQTRSDSILSKLDVKGMTKEIVKSLTVLEQTPEKLILTISEDKKALMSSINIQKVKDAIKKSGYNGEIVLQYSNQNNSSQLSKAFGGTIIN